MSIKKISYGEKGRIGLIYPNSAWCTEPEFYAMSPEGVITCTTRIRLDSVNVESIEKLSGQVESASALLAGSKVDMITLGCTSGSFLKGKGYDQEIIAKMHKASGGLPCSTTATAIVEAIEAFGARKIAVGTPYIDEINVRAQKFLKDSGYEVVNFVGLKLIDDWDINMLEIAEVEDLIRKADHAEAEMIAILCTSMKGITILDQLEKELGKPIITANQATFWQCLRILGVDIRITGFGSLFNK